MTFGRDGRQAAAYEQTATVVAQLPQAIVVAAAH
jgi:hypothetical protein